MKLRLIVLQILFVMCIQVNGFAQSGVTIEGNITDGGEGLPGVAVILEGTTIGTISDFNGDFRLVISETIDQPVIVFSFIGYKTQRIEGVPSGNLQIKMEEDLVTLEEIVVTGYAVQKKSDVTGSISTIKTENLARAPLSGVDQAMQGLASGVRVTQNTGAPGEGVAVRIRGVGSINSNNAPLYVVDGVPTRDAMNSLSTSDIESISILKDASSTAIYGSRANNGVVLITTKKGSGTDGMQVTFNSSTGIQRHGDLTPMTNRDEYIELFNEAATNDNAEVSNPRLHRQLITNGGDFADVNYLEEIFKTATIQNHYLGVSGGNDKTRYNISTSYFDQEGIVLGSDFQRMTGKVSVSSKANEWLDVGVNLNVAGTKTNIIGSSGDGFGGNGGGLIRYAYFRTPAIPILDDNGQYVDLPDNPEFFGDGYNPVALAHNTHNKKKAIGVFGDINMRITLNENLSFSSKLGIDNNNSNQRRFNRTWGSNDRINSLNSLVVTNKYIFNYSFTNHFNFNKTINDVHNFSGVIGTELIENNDENTETNERDFPDQTLSLINLGNGQGAITADENITEFKLLSFFARANYNYKEKYLFSVTGRRDGSSRFSKNNRWGTFYSTSVGWRIDKEPFLLNSNNIDQLKLRVGFGAVGNQEVDDFAFLEQIVPGKQYPFGGVPQDGFFTDVKGNEDLQWETSKQWDIGTDMSFYQGKLDLTIDYFHKVTDDMLIREIPPTSAGDAKPAWTNNGKILNSGIELEIGYHYNIGEMGFAINANASKLHNEVLKLPVPFSGGRIDNGVFATKTEKGSEVGEFFLYEMEGIFQNDIDVVTHAFQGNGIQPGDVKYKDQNGDGIIDDLDRKFVGGSIPDLTYGVNIAMDYKNFDLSLFFQGVLGQDIYGQVNTDIEGFYRPFNLTKRFYNERWTGEGSSNSQPRASWRAKSNNTRPSTRFLEDGSYLRLKNLQLGYNFPKRVLESLSINKLRVYFSGTNLITFTKYLGLDPEITTSDNSTEEGDRAANIDWGTYPTAISLIMGLQLTF